jgi:uncharacterized FlaG/YvyC family protein
MTSLFENPNFFEIKQNTRAMKRNKEEVKAKNKENYLKRQNKVKELNKEIKNLLEKLPEHLLYTILKMCL